METRTPPAPEGGRRAIGIADGTAGDRLDRVLAGALPGLSRVRARALIETGEVALATADPPGARTVDRPSYRVKPNQVFLVSIPAAADPDPEGQTIPLAVVHEDDDLVVLDKPAGLVVHPAPGNPDGTLVNALIAHCAEGLSGIGGVRRPGIVHRLDKLTSGLMVVAKNDDAHRGLAAQFKARSIERAYTALVWGRSGASGTIEGNIGRSPRNRKKMAVLAGAGRPALTHWRRVRALGSAATVLECRLVTGRTHQIRVHLAHRGMPVIGDGIYGGGMTAGRRARLGDGLRAAADLDRQALHAHLLGFVHPGSGRAMRFVAPLPIELEELIELLENI